MRVDPPAPRIRLGRRARRLFPLWGALLAVALGMAMPGLAQSNAGGAPVELRLPPPVLIAQSSDAGGPPAASTPPDVAPDAVPPPAATTTTPGDQPPPATPPAPNAAPEPAPAAEVSPTSPPPASPAAESSTPPTTPALPPAASSPATAPALPTVPVQRHVEHTVPSDEAPAARSASSSSPANAAPNATPPPANASAPPPATAPSAAAGSPAPAAGSPPAATPPALATASPPAAAPPAAGAAAPAGAVSAGAAPAAAGGTDAEREKLFEQFFGKAKKQGGGEKRLDVPVTLDGQDLGMVGAILPDDVANARLLLVSLQSALKPVVVDSVLTKIAAVPVDNGYIPITALKDAGLGAKIDPLTLSLSLNVPGELRKAQVVDLKGHGAPPVTGVGAAVTPATVSSYINAHALQDYVHNGATPGIQPLSLGLDGAIDYKGEVLQSTFNYVSADSRRWQRGDTRFVHDDPERAMRYQLGDLLYSLAGLQTSSALGGLSVARDYTLQPYTNIQPAGQQQFILTSPSKVEVDVNGRPTQVIQLPAGRYDIRNFPFAQGANDVNLKITDQSGRVTTTTVPFFFDSTLLDAGVTQFNYAVGLPMQTDNGLRRYPGRFPSFTMFHRLGVTDAITAGVNAQGNERQEMVGLELGTATPVGNLHFDVAGSRTADFGYDYAAQAQYSYSNISETGVARNLITQVSFTGDRFSTLGTTAPANTSKIAVSTRYSQPLLYDVYGGIGGTYQVNRNKDNSYNFDVNFRRNITQTINADVDLIRSFDENGKIDNRILLTLTVSFDGGRQFGRAGYDSDQRAKTADWEYIPTSDLYHPYGDLHLGNSTQTNQINGDFNYNTTRFETTVSHNETYPAGGATTGSAMERDTSLAFGSALVFADGKAALARPISDSFAIVGEQKNAAGYAFKVDPQADNYTTRNDFFMPAVIPNLNAYELRTTQLDVPDLPAGYDIGPETFVLQPTYRSGSLIELGTDATVFLDGVLVGSNDKPLSLISGTIKEAGASTAQPITFFTNRAGRFRVEGLKPGKFEMDFAGAFPGVKQSITIPPEANGIYHIGTIKLSVEQSE